MRRLLVAVRDLDPPGGGAERSLAALINGLARPGPVASTAPEFLPAVPAETVESHGAWEVHTLSSKSRGVTTDLLDKGVEVERLALPIEGPWSRVAWALRERTGSRRPRHWAHRRHLARRNKQVEAEVGQWLSTTGPGIGLTQLDWAAGAASAFQAAGLPWMVFVRDEIVFRFPSLYRPAIEGAALVCAAGEGLLSQIEGAFSLRAKVNVPLPIDFGGRFGPLEDVRARVATARRDKPDDARPRISVVGVTPEKGLATYHRLLPRMAEVWPEAEVELVGGGKYIEELGRYPNVLLRGPMPVEDVFPHTDVHLLLVETTGSWGRVINEAGLHGVPTVTCSIGSQPEAVGPGGMAVKDHHDIDGLIAALRQTMAERDMYGQRALAHAGVVDHRRSVAIFREAVEGLLDT